MAIEKRVVCLANSRKLSARCVAGKEMVEGFPWVRPVSPRPSEELAASERHYADGTEPRLLDVIDMRFVEPKPNSYQTENWLLDSNSPWNRVGQITWLDLLNLVDEPSCLWLNNTSTTVGENDRVPKKDAVWFTESLYLLRLTRLTLRVCTQGPRKRVQCLFLYNSDWYALWVTDPIVELYYQDKEDGDYEIAECCITVSLGEAYQGFCYKVVAAVMTAKRTGA